MPGRTVTTKVNRKYGARKLRAIARAKFAAAGRMRASAKKTRLLHSAKLTAKAATRKAKRRKR